MSLLVVPFLFLLFFGLRSERERRRKGLKKKRMFKSKDGFLKYLETGEFSDLTLETASGFFFFCFVFFLLWRDDFFSFFFGGFFYSFCPFSLLSLQKTQKINRRSVQSSQNCVSKKQ